MKEKGLMFKDKKTRYPYGIFVVSIFLILTGLAQSTLTITDSSITDSTNGILIDITNDYISFNNATFTSNISIDGNTIASSNITGWDSKGEGDFETTKIMNSNGNSWPATGANIQVAIENSTSDDIITLPTGNFTISTALDMTNHNNTIIQGQGKATQLYLADATNDEMLIIYGGHDITIRDISFNGNCWGQSSAKPVIQLRDNLDAHVSDITIKDCYFYNGSSTFIRGDDTYSSQPCDIYNVTVDNCRFDYISTTLPTYPAAVFVGGDNWKVTNNYIKDTYGSGIVVEETDTGTHLTSWYNLIDGNTITGACDFGIYIEGIGGGNLKSRYNVVSNNIIHDLTDTTSYTTVPRGAGIRLREGDVCSNNIIKGIESPNYGMIVEGNNSITACRIEQVDGIGIESSTGSNVLISNTHLFNITEYGIYLNGHGQINNCHFSNINTDQGSKAAIIIHDGWVTVSICNFTDIYNVGINIYEKGNSTIIGNTFTDMHPDVGNARCIYLGTSDYNVVTGNRMASGDVGVKEDTGGTYNICTSNIGVGCTNGIDVDGTGSINANNIE